MKSLVKIIKYNLPQLLFLLTVAKVVVLEWGRGAGKSTILAKRIIDCVLQMPRSTGMLYGESYMQIKTRTLPSTIKGLEEHGYIKGIHYFIGEKPPKEWNWPEPHQPPLDYKNVVIFWNGTCMHLVSQDGNASSGRGMNVDWIVNDETLLLDGEKFMTDASATNRGNLFEIAEYPDGTWKYYKDCHLHHSIMLASSTPTSIAGQWFLKYEEQARDPKNNTLFLRASALDNIENLGEDYIESQRAIMPDFLFDAEIMNIRISAIKDGFYPKLNEKIHEYTSYNLDYVRALDIKDVDKITCEMDADLRADLPLICSIDWGANINCMPVGQLQGNEIKVLKALFVKSPKILDDLAAEFIRYYEPHKAGNNIVKIWYDPTGNLKVANSRQTYAQQFAAILRANGWNVELMTRGVANVSHEDKYNMINSILSETDTNKYPLVRINRHNCAPLLISMKHAPAKRGLKVAIQKGKASEKNKSTPQEHATHFSDAFDLLLVGLCYHKYKGAPSLPPNRVQ